MSEPELHRREAPSMFLGASESGQDARTSRAMPPLRAPAAPNAFLLPAMAFFLALAVGWLVFSGTAGRILEPGVTELRDLQKISASVATPPDRCDATADAGCDATVAILPSTGL